MGFFQRLAERGGFAGRTTKPAMVPKDRGMTSAIARQTEDEEEAQPIRLMRQEAEQEEEALPLRRSVRRQNEEEEPALQTLRRQEDEEEEAQALRREIEEEEPEAQALRRQEEEKQAQPSRLLRLEEEEDAQPARRQVEEEEEEVQALRRQTKEEEEAQPDRLRRQEEGEEAQAIRRMEGDDDEPEAARLFRKVGEDDPDFDPSKGPPADLPIEDELTSSSMMPLRRKPTLGEAAGPRTVGMDGTGERYGLGDQFAETSREEPGGQHMAFDPQALVPGSLAALTGAIDAPRAHPEGEVIIEQVDVVIHEQSETPKTRPTDTRRALRARYMNRL